MGKIPTYTQLNYRWTFLLLSLSPFPKIRFPFNEKCICKAEIVNFLKIMDKPTNCERLCENFLPFCIRKQSCLLLCVWWKMFVISKTHTPKTLIYLCLESGSINWNGIKIINFRRRTKRWVNLRQQRFVVGGEMFVCCRVLCAIINFN